MKVTGRQFAQTMVMITHNEEIAQLADRIVRIEDGRIVTQYQSETAGDTYISTGVNWGYTGARLSDLADPAAAI